MSGTSKRNSRERASEKERGSRRRPFVDLRQSRRNHQPEGLYDRGVGFRPLARTPAAPLTLEVLALHFLSSGGREVSCVLCGAGAQEEARLVVWFCRVRGR